MTTSALIDSETLDRLEKDVGPQVVGRIIDLFLERGSDLLQALRSAVESDDLPAAAEALHSIKSSAGMLGARELSEVAERAERLARRGKSADVAALMESFETTCAETTTLLCDRRQTLTGGD